MTNKIILDISHRLYESDSIFFTFVQDLVNPSFNENFPTAAVTFKKDDLDKCIDFSVNPKIWDSLNSEEKFFLFVHECFHVLLSHGSRGKEFLETLPEKNQSYEILNKAMDIAINEIILKTYSKLPLSLMPVISEGCFISTCFADPNSILEDQTFDYYYMKLLEEKSSGGGSFDDHIFLELSDEELEELNEKIKEIAGKEIENISEKNISEIMKKMSKNYSTEHSNTGEFSISALKDKKYSIEGVLKSSLATAIGKEKEKKKKSNWYKLNRRTISLPKELTIPMTEEKKSQKFKVVAYCDVSGSVSSISEKFFYIMNTLDDNKYEKEIYAFGTSTVPVKRKGSSYSYSGAGGGTDILKVLNHFEREVEKNKPDLVIVLTDGYYQNISNLTEKKYSNWNFFFIISNMNNCPKNSKKTIIEGMIR